jgi:hypothetical protein
LKPISWVENLEIFISNIKTELDKINKAKTEKSFKSITPIINRIIGIKKFGNF